MNAHDSEKVIGTLEQQGYARVQDEGDAGLILYNTCSIRDKAEQKVFHRLNEYKKLQGEGKKFAVLGCVAQQEGEKIFEKAPYVSLVAGSASYLNLPEMLRRLEAGEERITGLDDRQTDQRPLRVQRHLRQGRIRLVVDELTAAERGDAGRLGGAGHLRAAPRQAVPPARGGHGRFRGRHRLSLGRPSARSATTVLSTSLAPPAIV